MRDTRNTQRENACRCFHRKHINTQHLLDAIGKAGQAKGTGSDWIDIVRLEGHSVDSSTRMPSVLIGAYRLAGFRWAAVTRLLWETCPVNELIFHDAILRRTNPRWSRPVPPKSAKISVLPTYHPRHLNVNKAVRQLIVCYFPDKRLWTSLFMLRWPGIYEPAAGRGCESLLLGKESSCNYNGHDFKNMA